MDIENMLKGKLTISEGYDVIYLFVLSNIAVWLFEFMIVGFIDLSCIAALLWILLSIVVSITVVIIGFS